MISQPKDSVIHDSDISQAIIGYNVIKLSINRF